MRAGRPFWERSAFQERLGGLSSRSDNYTLGIFVGRVFKGVRDLYEVGCYVVQLGAHRIVRSHWVARSARKPAVVPSGPVDSVRKFHQIAIANDDLLSQGSGLCQPTFAVPLRRLVDGTIVVFHNHNCGPPAPETSEGNPAGYFYIWNEGELPPAPRKLGYRTPLLFRESAMDDYQGGRLKAEPDNTGSFVERPTLNSRPLKAKQRGGTWFESTAAHTNSADFP